MKTTISLMRKLNDGFTRKVVRRLGKVYVIKVKKQKS